MSLLIFNAVLLGAGLAVVYGLIGVVALAKRPAAPSQTGRARLTVRHATFALAIVVVWLMGGALRADDVARRYFTTLVAPSVPGGTVVEKVPAAPPFWVVKIDADVTQPDGITVAYTSHQLLAIEPWTGWVIVLARG